MLDALYPDLVAPTPAVGMAVLKPGQQVQTMLAGHVVQRGTRLVAGLQPGLSTRCTYTTAQDVTLWPIEIAAVGYYQDRSALAAAGIGADRRRGAARRRCASRSQRAGKGVARRARRSTGSTSAFAATAPRRRRSSTRCSAPCAAVGARAEATASR